MAIMIQRVLNKLNQYKICVYAVCKNEEQFVDRWMDAAAEADAVIAADTGSIDRTVEKLRERGAAVYEAYISPWRSDKARNAALSHVPEDADICVCADLDEIFEPGWRQKLESAWKPEHTQARCQFVWSNNSDGTPNQQYPVEKIHRRHGFRWVHPAHEDVLKYSGTDPDKTVWAEGLILHHYPDPSKPKTRRLPLLELAAEENPRDDRAMFWLGREYFFYGKYDPAVETLKKHLSLPSAKWAEERSASMGFIARCYEAREDMSQAKAWLFRALAECPDVREPYLGLVKLGYREGDWPLTCAMAEKGMSIIHDSGSYLVQPESWGAALYDYGSISAYNMGLYEKARDYARRACEHSPDDDRLQSNLSLMEKRLAEHMKGGSPL